MTFEGVVLDVERFFIKYTVEKQLEGIGPEDLFDAFYLYMSQYLVHKDPSMSEKLN